MNGKEKLYFLLGAIQDVRVLTPKGKPLLIDPVNNLNRQYRELELAQLFEKLQKDEQILRVIKTAKQEKMSTLPLPYRGLDHRYYAIVLLPRFDDYFSRIEQELEYQKFTGKKPQPMPVIQLNRQSLEKIWHILEEIETKRGITPAGGDVSIPSIHRSKVKNDKEAQEAADERFGILRKLESEEGAIKDVRWSHNLDQYVYLKPGDRYPENY